MAVVPAKAFGQAKSRLSGWPAAARAALAAQLLATVVAALRESGALRRVVVVGPPEVADYARRLGAEGWEEAVPSLNGAVDGALARLGVAAPRLVVMADLPLLRPRHVRRLVRTAGRAVVCCPSRQGAGTNALWLPAGVAWQAVFEGPASLAAHLKQARARGVAVRVRPWPGFWLDIDTPSDLACWERRAPTAGPSSLPACGSNQARE